MLLSSRLVFETAYECFAHASVFEICISVLLLVFICVNCRICMVTSERVRNLESSSSSSRCKCRKIVVSLHKSQGKEHLACGMYCGGEKHVQVEVCHMYYVLVLPKPIMQ